MGNKNNKKFREPEQFVIYDATNIPSVECKYYKVLDMTYDQKLEMYMKVKKKKLAKMLIEANRVLDLKTEHNDYLQRVNERIKRLC